MIAFLIQLYIFKKFTSVKNNNNQQNVRRIYQKIDTNDILLDNNIILCGVLQYNENHYHRR